MPKGDCLEIEGVVVDMFKDDIKIKLINGHIITGYLAGKLRINNIRVMVGDKVKVEIIKIGEKGIDLKLLEIIND